MRSGLVTLAAASALAGCAADHEAEYTTNSNGDFNLPSPNSATMSDFTFDTGACTDVNGHAVVVETPEGASVGCGVLGADPWANVALSTSATGTVTNQVVNVAGYSIGSAVSTLNADSTAYNARGRAVVLHNANGDRIMCGCCVEEGSTITMGTYPGYTGSLSPSGTVRATTTSGPATISLTSTFTGLEASASNGIHVHVGTSCANADDIGGHLFSDDVAVIGAFPGYTGPAAVSGTAKVAAASGSSISFSGYLVDDGNTFAADTSGDIGFHEGLSCDSASAVGDELEDPCEVSGASSNWPPPSLLVGLYAAACAIRHLLSR